MPKNGNVARRTTVQLGMAALQTRREHDRNDSQSPEARNRSPASAPKLWGAFPIRTPWEGMRIEFSMACGGVGTTLSTAIPLPPIMRMA